MPRTYHQRRDVTRRNIEAHRVHGYTETCLHFIIYHTIVLLPSPLLAFPQAGVTSPWTAPVLSLPTSAGGGALIQGRSSSEINRLILF